MATSVTNTAFLVGNGFSQDGQTSMDLLVAAYRRTRQPAIDALQSNQDKLTKQQVFFNSVRSKLDTFQSLASSFLDASAADKFVTRKVVSSDATVATVSSASTAPVGVSTLKVNRMATNDVFLSDKVTTSTAFSAELASRGLNPAIATGTKAFTLNGRSYSVTLDGSETNEGVINKIVTAVNSDADSKVSAMLVKNTSTSGRLTLTSKTLGSDGAVTFGDTDSLLSGFGFSGIKQATGPTALNLASSTVAGATVPGFAAGTQNFSVNGINYSITNSASDSHNTILNAIANAINTNNSSTVSASVVDKGSGNIALQLTNNDVGGTLSVNDTSGFLANYGINTQSQTDVRTVSTNTKAGYTSSQESSLNSLTTINGISISRSSNNLEGVLTGVTINLVKAQAANDNPLTLTSSVDGDAVGSLIQPMLDSYNEAIKYLQNNTKTLGGNDSTVRSLTSRLRSLSGSMMANSTDDVKYLSDVGIKIGTDGTLSVGDKTTLQKLLESDPSKVAKVFTGTNGFASQVNSMLTEVVGTDGLAQSRSAALGKQIKTIGTRLTDLKTKIDREVVSQQNEYKKLQKSFYALQDQMSKYSQYTSGY